MQTANLERVDAFAVVGGDGTINELLQVSAGAASRDPGTCSCSLRQLSALPASDIMPSSCTLAIGDHLSAQPYLGDPGLIWHAGISAAVRLGEGRQNTLFANRGRLWQCPVLQLRLVERRHRCLCSLQAQNKASGHRIDTAAIPRAVLLVPFDLVWHHIEPGHQHRASQASSCSRGVQTTPLVCTISATLQQQVCTIT